MLRNDAAELHQQRFLRRNAFLELERQDLELQPQVRRGFQWIFNAFQAILSHFEPFLVHVR